MARKVSHRTSISSSSLGHIFVYCLADEYRAGGWSVVHRVSGQVLDEWLCILDNHNTPAQDTARAQRPQVGLIQHSIRVSGLWALRMPYT